MAISTMDNASAELAIALQLNDLDELEASGTVDKLVIRLQRQQLEIDSGFDAITFEASRRLALSMARAVEDDSGLLVRSARLPLIDDETFDRLKVLNYSRPAVLERVEVAPRPQSKDQTLPSMAESRKRARSSTPEHGSSSASFNSKDAELRCSSHTDHAMHSHKKIRGEEIASVRNPRNQVGNSGMSLVQDPQAFTADVSATQIVRETAAPAIAIETSPTSVDCVSCSDHLVIDQLVKVSCEHCYCKDCFGHFVEASLQTHDGFPPKCCKIPIAFIPEPMKVTSKDHQP